MSSSSKSSNAVPIPADSISISHLEESIFYKFKDPHLLQLALTHESFSNEHEIKFKNNERLEFLGDSVLGCIVCLYLYQHFPQQSEGVMAKIKSYVVSTQYLAEQANKINLGRYLRLGHGEDIGTGRLSTNILADAMEAVIGAIYLDGGFEPAQRLVLSLLRPAMDSMEGARRDYKSLLQEYTQRFFHELPEYDILEESGPAHDRFYRMAVRLGGKILGNGQGHRKKDAGQEAALQACRLIEAMLGYDKHLAVRLPLNATDCCKIDDADHIVKLEECGANPELETDAM